MTMVFIVPVKSARVAKSWSRVSQLFERTVKSICHQTCPDFQVIVACHERPEIDFSHPRVSYLEVDFPVPVWQPTGKTKQDYADLRRDKSRKIWKALIEAGTWEPSHVMFVDADDCVSNRIAEFVKQNSQHNGWFVDRGYEYEDGTNRILPRKEGFYQKCGTSHIVKYPLLEAESLKYEDIDYEYMRHSHLKKFLEKKGKYLEPLPFTGSIYITENRENIWLQKQIVMQRMAPKDKLLFYGRQIFKFFFSKPVTDEIRQEFGLYELN